MSASLIGLAAFGLMFAASVGGLLLGKVLPESHRGAQTERLVGSSMRMISYLSILVLGLMVATAKTKFDSNNLQVERLAANLMMLNRELPSLGPMGSEAKGLLRKYAVAKIANMWRGRVGPEPMPSDPEALQLLETLQQKVVGLVPEGEDQRAVAKSASDILGELIRSRWLQVAQESDHVPQPFMWVLIAWLSLLFAGMGLFAPRNGVSLAALLLCAVSISGAIALIVDMDTPFAGLVVVSPEPMLAALAQIDAP